MLVTPAPASAQINRPPIALDVEASSLRRASEEWIIETLLTLRATDEGEQPSGMQWVFRILNPASRVRCFQPVAGGGTPTLVGGGAATFEITVTDDLDITCKYSPPVGRVGDDQFQYEGVEQSPASGATNLRSAVATVTVDIKPQGLRWQFQTGAGQSFSSDSGTSGLADIPDILGKTDQDFLFSLDWVFRNPQKRSSQESVGAATADGHFVFRTGYRNKADAVVATPLPTGNLITGAGTTTTAPAQDAVAPRRKFSVGGEVNYNFVVVPGDNGSFIELGGLGRANLDIDVEDTETLKQTGERILRLARKSSENGSFSFEAGGRVVIKQFHEEMFRTTVQRQGSTTQAYTRNTDELLAVEFGLQRDETFKTLESLGFKPVRYFVRVVATLIEIPGVSGHTKPMFGVELTGGRDQPRLVKLLYGADISAIGTLFGIGK